MIICGSYMFEFDASKDMNRERSNMFSSKSSNTNYLKIEN